MNGQPEDRAHDTLPVLIVRDRKSKGIWSHPVPSKCVTQPVSCKGSDGRSRLHVGTGESSSSRIRSPALSPCVTLSRMVGTTRWCLKHLPRARARATERSNVLFDLCTDLRGPSKTLEPQSGNTLESRSQLLAWLVEHCSNLLLLFHKGERHTMATQPTCVGKVSSGEFSCRSLVSALTIESALDTSWSRGGREVCSWVF